MVNIEGLDKLELLRALWEKQKPCPEYRERDLPQLTDEKAAAALVDDDGYVHFVCGKYIKIDFSKDDVGGALYDEYAGGGSLETVVKNLRLNSSKDGFQSAFHNAVQNSLLTTIPQSRDYIRIRGDGACYWRCILESTREIFGFSPNVNFVDGTGVEIFKAIDLIRSDTASFIVHLQSKDPEEWNHINITAQLLLDDRKESLDAWLTRMQTPLQQLTGQDRWADELVFAVTPRMLRTLGVDVDIRVQQWVTTDQQNNVIREVDVILPASTSSIVINLRYYTHENGNGYHYDLLASATSVATHPMLPSSNNTAENSSESEKDRGRVPKRQSSEPTSAKKKQRLHHKAPTPNVDLNENLLQAATRGDVREVISLIDAGADVNFSNGSIVRAAVHAGHSSIVNILINAGAKVSSALVRHAATTGHARIIDTLIGSDNVTTSVKTDALIRATSNGFTGVVKVLMAAGATANNMALDLAVERGDVNMVKLHLDHGAREPKWESVVKAVESGFFRVIDVLIEYNVIHVRQGDSIVSGGFQILTAAVKYGHLALSERLIKQLQRFSNFIYDVELNNALYVAASNGRLEIVKLICNTIGVDYCNGDCRAVRLAARNGHKNVVNFILQQMALSVGLPETTLCFKAGSAFNRKELADAMCNHIAVVLHKYYKALWKT